MGRIKVEVNLDEQGLSGAELKELYLNLIAQIEEDEVASFIEGSASRDGTLMEFEVHAVDSEAAIEFIEDLLAENEVDRDVSIEELQ